MNAHLRREQGLQTSYKLLESLQESQDRYRNLVEVLSDVVFEHDGHGLVLLNSAWSHHFGHSLEDSLEHSLAEFTLPSDREPLDSWFQTSLEQAGCPTLAELRLIDSLGEPRWVEINGCFQADTGKYFGIIREIGSRKQAEQTLLESESLFRQLANTIDVLIWMSDTHHQAIFFNASWLEFTGLTRVQALGEGWIGAIHPDDSPGCQQSYHQARLNVQDFSITYRLRRHDGAYRWIEDHGRPRLGPDGAFLGYIGASRDITDVLQAKATLQDQQAILEERVHERTTQLAASEAKFRALVEQSMVGIFILQDGLIRYANRAAAKIRGCDDPEQLIGLSWYDFAIPQEQDRLRAIVPPDSDSQWLAYRIMRTDGTEIDIETCLRRFNYEGLPATIGISLDVTASRHAEAALRESEVRQSLAISASNIGLWDWNLRNNKVIYSREYKALLGYDECEIGDDFYAWKDRLHPEDSATLFSGIECFLKGQEREFIAEYRIRHKDDSWRWMYARAQVFRDERGVPQRMLGCNIDLTERKRIEEDRSLKEERLRLAQQCAQIGIWEWHLHTGVIIWTPELERIYGFEPGSFTGSYQDFSSRIHSDDLQVLENLRDKAVAAHQTFECDFRIQLPCGQIRWVHGKGSAHYDASGRPERIYGVIFEITERKLMEQRLENALHQQALLSRRLLTVQEEERRLLARELHDEIGQVLTAVKINLQAAQVTQISSGLQQRLQECISITSQAIQQVSGRSLELRPSLLDDLGLIPAMEQYVERQTELGKCAIEFRFEPLTERPPPETEIACYRVMQEAITNILRHASASIIRLRLVRNEQLLQLRIWDDGRGFDVNEARRRSLSGGSFGLLGMEERAVLAGGGIEFASQPGQGCEIRAWFPLPRDYE